jgi:hypothetical protein
LRQGAVALAFALLALPVILMLLLMVVVTAMPILALAILPVAVVATAFTLWWRYEQRSDARRTGHVVPLHRAR